MVGYSPLSLALSVTSDILFVMLWIGLLLSTRPSRQPVCPLLIPSLGLHRSRCIEHTSREAAASLLCPTGHQPPCAFTPNPPHPHRQLAQIKSLGQLQLTPYLVTLGGQEPIRCHWAAAWGRPVVRHCGCSCVCVGRGGEGGGGVQHWRVDNVEGGTG